MRFPRLCRRSRLLSLSTVLVVAGLTLVALPGHTVRPEGSSPAGGKPAAAGDYATVVRPFLATHCFGCHGEKTAKGDLRLDTLLANPDDPVAAETWAHVGKRLQAGEMPPKKQPQPTAAEKEPVLRWLAARTAVASVPHPSLRRLNRIEYENTLRDLLDLPALDVKDFLPPDGNVQGFDTVADGLDLSHVQMASYLAAADHALDQAVEIALQPKQPEVRKLVLRPQDEPTWMTRLNIGAVIPLAENGPDPLWNPETGFVRDKPLPLDGLRKKPSLRALGTFFHYDGAGRLQFNDKLSFLPGRYHVRFSAYGFDWNHGKLLPATGVRPYRLGTPTRLFGYFDAPPNKPDPAVFTTWLEPQEVIDFNPVSLGHGVGLDKEGSRGWAGPGVAVEFLEMEGPLYTTWPPPSRSLLFGDLPLREWKPEMGPHKPSRQHHKVAWWMPEPPLFTVVSEAPTRDAERLLQSFMTRACRRPVTAEEVRPYLKLVQAKLDDHATFEEALRTGYKAILCSSQFLFLRQDPGKPDAYALASRLSYFLWSSMPDEELLRHAADGSLLHSDVLRQQTERLLKDEKASRFVENFTGQWLKLRAINATQPDPQLYPLPELESDVAPYLWDSMVGESRSFFATMLREDLATSNVVDSDFVMVNDVLAKLYGLPGVSGSTLRPVKLPPGSHRGGILTQAAVLKVTANGTTTSPVTRGAWIMTNLLGQQPPPPPPNVAAIDPDVRGTTTIRERLAKHRSAETCANCHARFDPAGFALENYDVLGGWRQRYRTFAENRLNLEGPAVDPSGETVDGRKFRDVEGFKGLLLANPDQVTRNLALKLLLYGSGRVPQPADQAEVETLVGRLRSRQGGLRSLIHEVVQSKAFRQAE